MASRLRDQPILRSLYYGKEFLQITTFEGLTRSVFHKMIPALSALPATRGDTAAEVNELTQAAKHITDIAPQVLLEDAEFLISEVK